MKITTIFIGKTTDKNLATLIQGYQDRIGHYINFEIDVIPELRSTKNLTQEQQKEKEGDQLIQHLKTGDYLILLDEKGKQFRSVEFADYLSRQFALPYKRLIFVVGGPYGFSSKIYKIKNAMLSISQMTFSHQMIRLLFIEQLYRALTIQKGEPYHHE